jgi:hypothetical protein
MRDISKNKTVTIDSEITFDKQRVRKVTIMREGSDILSGEVEMFSSEHDVTEREGISVNLSEVPMNVQGVINGIETFTGEKVDLEKLTVSDFINSIVHENIKRK